MNGDRALPVGVDRSWLYFAMLFVGACILFTSIGLWFAHADKDYHFSYSHTRDDPPRYKVVDYYDQLSPEQQEMFHRAVEDGTSYGLEGPEKLPDGEVIRYQEKYYVFDMYAYYDWLDPWTAGSTLTGLFGLGVMVDAARRDFHHRRI